MNHFTGKKDRDEDSVKATPSIDRVEPMGDLAPNVCPKCERPMELAKSDELFILMCQSCHGLLVQSEVLAQLIRDRRKKYTGPEDVPKPMNAFELNSRLTCPGCRQKMDVHPYHGPGNAVIDSCASCKFAFLDQGELTKIERAPGLR